MNMNKKTILIPLISLVGVIAVACGSAVSDDPVAPELNQQPAVAQEADQSTPTPQPAPEPAATASGSSGASLEADIEYAAAPSPVAATAKPPSLAIASGTSALGVEADPEYAEAFRKAGLSDRDWSTDFRFHTIPFDEITRVIRRDGIPSIDNPTFISPKEAEAWLEGVEPVISLEIDGVAKAYPLQILTWHEIVNDEVAGVPVAVTFCPLCNSAIVFERELDGVVYEFGVSGNLRNSDLIMYDRQTHTWWQQFTGEGIVGELTTAQLRLVGSGIISFEDFKSANPDGSVLSRDTGFSRSYGQNPYAGYDRVDNPPFLFQGDTDGRLLPKERVAAIAIGDVDAAFPYSILEEEKAINYNVNGQDVAVFFKLGTASALDGSLIAGSKDVGSTGVFNPEMDGQKLTFKAEGETFVDIETGSTWNILGQAVAGPMTGKQLERIVHADHFWFAWAAFKPDTLIYRGNSG